LGIISNRFFTNYDPEVKIKLIVSLDRDEDGIWIAECPSIPGCVSQGSTREEVLVFIK
jgi:predicted RNase H-like HicB family nuclease